MTAEALVDFQRLCRILSPFSTSDAVAAALPAPDGWASLIAMADGQYVLPELHGVLAGHGLTDRVPSPVAAMLEGYFDIAAGRNAELRLQMRELTTLLSAAGVTPVWLKGALLLTQDGWQRSGRVMGDLDLWIPDPEDQRTALRCLEDAGYAVHPGEVDEGWDDMHHFAPRFHPQKPAQLELHRHVVRPALADLLPDREVLARVRWRTWQGLTIGEPGSDDRIMHSLVQCTFMSTPRLLTGRPRLVKYLDLARLLAAAGGPELPAAVIARIGPRRRRLIARFLTFAESALGLVSPFPPDPWLVDLFAFRLTRGRMPLWNRAVLRSIGMRERLRRRLRRQPPTGRAAD